MRYVASLFAALPLITALVGCSSEEPEADPPISASSSETTTTPEQPDVSEFEGTFTGDIVITTGTFEAFAKGTRVEGIDFLVSCPDTECATADLRLDVNTASSFATTMTLTREGDTFTGDARRTNPCPSGTGEGTTVTEWTLTQVATDQLDGTFDLAFTGCDPSGTAKAKVTAERTARTAGYLDTEAGTAFVTAFAAYNAALAGLYTDYPACSEREGKAFAACVLALYEPWSTALPALIEPVEQARDAATGPCASHLKQLDLVALEKRQKPAIAALEKHERGVSPKENETFIKLAVAQHESLMRAVLMCVSPADTEPAVPADGFELDLFDAALDT